MFLAPLNFAGSTAPTLIDVSFKTVCFKAINVPDLP